MAKVIVYKNPDGDNVCVCYPAAGADLKAVLASDCPPGAIVIEEGRLPFDGGYFGAWRLKNNRVVIDLDAARDIHRDMIRRLRGPVLKALDVAYQRADEEENPEAKRQIAAQKKALRDATDDPAITAATTIDALMAVWPLALGPRA